MANPLFELQNNFYIGAYSAAINEGSDLTDLDEQQAVERDCFVHRSYIANGSYEVRRGGRRLGRGQTIEASRSRVPDA